MNSAIVQTHPILPIPHKKAASKTATFLSPEVQSLWFFASIILILGPGIGRF